jgi:membrane-associated protein
MQAILDFFHKLGDLDALIRWGGYGILAAIVFAETGLLFGFFLPGDSLLVTAGLVAAAGEMSLPLLIVLLSAMAIIGDACGYLIGKKAGPKIFTREKSLFFAKEHLLRTKRFYEKHGGKTIIIARFMPLVRTFAPVVAGVGEMPYRRFAAFNVFGGIGWVVSMTCVGFFLGRLVPNIREHIFKVVAVVIFLSILPGIIAWARERFGKKEG